MFINETPREQLNLFEERLDDIISPDNIVRFIDTYVNKLDLYKLGFKIPGTNGGKGRPPYKPSNMLKIYIYGYFNRIRSTRKLEAECKRNVELIWLTGRLSPDFKTIADFRKNNREGIKRIFKEFLKLCHKLELLSLRCVAIDGTKERAQNSLDNIYKREEIEKIEERIHEKINKYLEELELNDRTEATDYEFLSKTLSEKLAKLKKDQEKVEIIKKLFEQNPELEIYFANDKDSRYQNDNNRINAGYNCQCAVDEKNKLIIANDITNESNDLHQLNNMMDRIVDIKKDLGIEDKTIAIADAGYFDEREISEAENKEDFEVYVFHPRDSQNQKKLKRKKGKIPTKGFEKDDFKYDEDTDTFECPEGNLLKRTGEGYIEIGNGVRKYQYICKDCDVCIKRKLCTNNQKGRVVKTTEFSKEINKFRNKCNSDLGKKILEKRKAIVEHPFGTIKRNWGYGYFMQKGKEKVAAEFSFITFIYNLKRVLNLVTFERLMAVVES